MISIFTTKDNLESICMEPDKKPWLDMIIKLKQVYVNDDNIFSYNSDPEDDPLLTLDGMQIDICSSEKDYINNIPKNPNSVLKYPSGIFLLNIAPNDANKIQKDFGVICQSVSNLNYTPLTQPHLPTELIDGETGKSWNSMIAQFKQLPSNSALIIDAHLFAEDKFDQANNCYNEKKRDGLDNVFEILNSILPMTFNETYHVGVFITDMDKAEAAHRSRSNLANSQIASAINKLKDRLNRTYSINIEVVFFDSNDDGHKLIHNRRILSNYYIVTAEYKLATLRNGKSLCGQSIEAFPIFESIDSLPNTDKKEKRIRREIEQFKTFFNRQPNSNTALLYKNGKKIGDFSQLEHRFFQ